MRYLAEAFALGALHRGRSIEQFLGRAAGEVPGIRWVEIVPGEAGYRVVLHVYGDVGGEHFCDLVEFPPIKESDDEDFGEQAAPTHDAYQALALVVIDFTNPDTLSH